MGCLKTQSLEQRTRTFDLGETAEVPRQDDNHSPRDHQARDREQPDTQGIEPVPEERERMEEPSQESGGPERPVETERVGRQEPRKSQIKWPPSNADKAWEQLDEDLEGILESVLAGSAERKIEAMAEMVYSVGLERFGEKPSGGGRKRSEQPNRRERERRQIRKDLKALSNRWKRAEQSEKEALSKLREDLRTRLNSLSKAERTRKKRKERERRRAAFISNPFRFTKRMLGTKTSGKLTCSVEEVEDYLRITHGDSNRETEIGDLEELQDPQPPTQEMDCSEIKLAEVRAIIRKARAGSAPGPSGTTYQVYKKCPKLTIRLWKLIRVLWRKRKVPNSWKRAEGVFCPKQENAESIGQFRTISLLSVEGKVFFAIIARRLLKYMMRNHYINTSMQKGGVPGFSGCLEHTSMLTQMLEEARAGKKDLAIVWLDLENAYGSVPHQLIKTALAKYHIPEQARRVITQYLDGLQIRFTVNGMTTSWQNLERGIVTGCTISVILFVAAMNLLIEPSTRQSRGPKTRSGVRQPPIRAFMDDLTLSTESVLGARHMLRSLDRAATWARMRFKAKKCRKLVLRKGKLCDKLQLEIQGEKIPSVSDQPVKSLGKKFDKTLADVQNVKEFRKQAEEGLRKIEESNLPGKYKLWCYQYGLLPRLTWPMTMYNIPLTTMEQVDKKISKYIRKWLGVPPGLTSVGLYSTTAKLQLPLTSALEEYKVAKVRAQATLDNSKDAIVREAGIKLRSGRKWSAAEAAESARSRLRHKDIVGVVAQGRLGLGAGTTAGQRWKDAAPIVRRKMLQGEIRRQEEEKRRAQAVSQGVQGAWVKWEQARERKVTWKELWSWEPLRTQFLLKSVYDLLPTPANLKRWGKESEEKCVLCGKRGTLSHLLTGCAVALGQGRYRWRHDRVLRVLAAALEEKRVQMSGRKQRRLRFVEFVKEGGKGKRRGKSAIDEGLGILASAGDWDLRVDLDRKLTFPEEITTTNQRPDIVILSAKTRQVVIMELTVPWEDRMEEAFERKAEKYNELKQSCIEKGWKTWYYPIEVGCRGFVGQSTWRGLGAVGIKGRKRKVVTKNLAEAAEAASRWLWMKSKEHTWKI